VKDYVEIMHRHGKVALVHMCGKINRLLPSIKQTGLDGIDALTPPPVGDVDFRCAYQLFGEKFVIHGILSPTEWLPNYLTLEDIERNVDELVKNILGKPFVLVVGADGIPGIPMEKFNAIAKYLQKFTLK